ncbi:MAG: hypothetical protein WCL04_06065 [Verrucomicrobiota bacterium]
MISYTPGKPANLAIKGDTGIKDSVVLGLPSGTSQTVQISDAVLNTTPATSVVSVAAGQPANNATAALTDRLNAEMANPNANPQLIQALQQSIARQQAQPATAGVVTSGVVAAPAGAIQLNSNVVNGQTIQTITVNGQSTVLQPGQNPNDVISAARAAGAQGQPPATGQ